MVNNKIDFPQFLHMFKTNAEFYNGVRDMVIEVGGYNLWDGHDVELFYEIWQER